jgi:hypothetical protein
MRAPRWNAELQAVEFGVDICEYGGAVWVPRRVFQRLMPERPTRERCVEAYYSNGTGLRASPSGNYAATVNRGREYRDQRARLKPQVGDRAASQGSVSNPPEATIRGLHRTSLSFYAKGLEGRIYDANGGWKGRGVSMTSGDRAPWPKEGDKGTVLIAVHFQFRPNPLPDRPYKFQPFDSVEPNGESSAIAVIIRVGSNRPSCAARPPCRRPSERSSRSLPPATSPAAAFQVSRWL